MPNLELLSPYLLVAEQSSVRSSYLLDLLQEFGSVSQHGLATTKLGGINVEPELGQHKNAKRSSPPAELSPLQPNAKRSSPLAEISPLQPKVSNVELSDVL
jgi:hypothetical protein